MLNIKNNMNEQKSTTFLHKLSEVQHRSASRSTKGFTLIELLMVFAILTVIASIILISIGETRSKSRDAKRKLEVQSLQRGLELYYDDYGHYPIVSPAKTYIHLEEEAEAATFNNSMMDYMASDLEDPSHTSNSDYSYQYTSTDGGVGYKVCVILETQPSDPYCINPPSGSGIVDISGLGGGVTTIAYGSEYVFNSGNTPDVRVSILDSTHFVIAYNDYDNSNYGTAIIGTVSGDTISYGSEYVFNNGHTSSVKVAILNGTKFIIVYKDYDNSSYGTAIIGTVSGDTISYGSEYVFNNAATIATVSALDSAKVVIAYRDDGNSYYGTAIIGTVSGDTISYGSEYVFNDAMAVYTPVATLNSTKFVIAYNDAGVNSTAIIGTVLGDTISYGSEYVFNSGSSDDINISILDTNKFVVAYADGSNGNKGTANIGTVLGDTISYGSEYVFYNSVSYRNEVVTLNNNYFVVGYVDNVDNYGTAIISTVSGDTISYGSEYVFNNSWTGNTGMSALDSTHFVIAYNDAGVDGTASIGTIE